MSKYRAIRTNGFASRKESRRANELKLLEKCGVISNLQFQVSYLVIPKQEGERAANYVADFVYVENGVEVVEDTKGIKTPAYVLKRKLMLLVHGIRILET